MKDTYIPLRNNSSSFTSLLYSSVSTRSNRSNSNATPAGRDRHATSTFASLCRTPPATTSLSRSTHSRALIKPTTLPCTASSVGRRFASRTLRGSAPRSSLAAEVVRPCTTRRTGVRRARARRTRTTTRPTLPGGRSRAAVTVRTTTSWGRWRRMTATWRSTGGPRGYRRRRRRKRRSPTRKSRQRRNRRNPLQARAEKVALPRRGKS
mmetsp:Transcript_32527/g.69250  ORF Transcript_32527/g.69250 Transcript_32527/m.69250 type:complete len:208 (+) Transcript_32527:279-902(+)